MRQPIVAVVACVLAVPTLSAGVQQSQQPQQRPVFRSGAVFVSVDAYPRQDERVVEGLTKGDFEIFEDGKPQTVEEFEFIRVSPVTPDDERRDPVSVDDGYRQAADPHNRVFVVYLDIFNTSMFGGNYARAPIIEFLTRAIGPKDLFAVMTPELPVSVLTFGRRADTLEEELRKHWHWPEGPDRKTIFPRNELEGRLIVCGTEGEALVRAYRKDLTVRSVEQMISRLGGLRDERKNVLFLSEGWSLPAGRFGGQSRSSYPSTPTVGVGPGGRLGRGTNMSGTNDAAWCDSQFGTLMNIDYQRRFRDLVEMAVRANVAFYPVDLAGLRVDTTLSGPPEMLRELAFGTGGTAVANTNDLIAGVRKIADDLSAFYLLGYYSSNSDADGGFRRINVKVKRPGVKVSARRGYFAPTPAMRKAELEAASKPTYEPTAVDREMARLSRLGTDAKVYTCAVHTPAGLDVIVEIASTEFADGRWTGGGTIKLDILGKEQGGKPVTADAKLDAGARAVVIRVPLPDASQAGWRVRVRVEGGGEVLDDEIDVAAGTPSFIGDATAFRTNSGPRAPLRPVADFKFFRTERLHVEWSLTKPIDECAARLLTRKGDAMPIPIALTERTDGDRMVLAADLTLAPLADGDYAMEVTARAGGEKVERLLAFRVVR